MKENKKKVLIIVMLLISMIIVYKIPRLLINKNNKPLPEVRLKEIKDSKAFAIMVQKGNDYEEYTEDTWPGEGYKYKEAKCINNKGNLINENIITFENDTVILETNQTVYCTLYFDKKSGISALDIVASKPNSLSPKANQGDMYRYQGTSELVNDNYICFGTKEKEECINDEDHYMYRIIGITEEGEIKLIKQTPVVEEGNRVFSWFKVTGTTENGSNLYGTAEDGLETWPESMIYKRLNGLSNGIITGDGQGGGTYSTNKNINADTDIFVDSREYKYLKSGDENGTNDGIGSEWYKLIEDHNWMYGDTEDSFNFNGHEMYKAETGQLETNYRYFYKDLSQYGSGTYTWNKETDKVIAKIALPYLHDFYLAYYDGETEETRGNSGVSSLGENWLLKIGPSEAHNKAVMDRCVDVNGSPFPSGFSGLRTVSSISGEDGRCSAKDITSYYKGIYSFPTFYLPNSIEMEGTGIETDPYRIVN